MPANTSVRLNTGTEMPTVGLGTWKSKAGAVEAAVAHALKYGYRHIDTAAGYGNEAEVGKGIRDSEVPRDQIFVTTKLDNCDHKDVEDALNRSLEKLGTAYLDLLLMHWPAPMNADCTAADKTLDWLDTWNKMVKVQKANPEKLHAIGVSNFSVKFLTRLLENSDVVPAVNQIELHPSCPQEDVVDFCRRRGIVVTAYSPLGSDNSPLLTNPIVVKLADKYNVMPANVLISLQVRPGVNGKPKNINNVSDPHVYKPVLSKSVTYARIESNLKIIDLTTEDISELQSIDKTNHFRACHPSWTGWGSLGFPDCLDADRTTN